jgi:hypothetical protein
MQFKLNDQQLTVSWLNDKNLAALAVKLTLVPSNFAVCLHAHTLPNAQSPKVGLKGKSEPAMSRGKSPKQRRYEDVCSWELVTKRSGYND